MTDPERLTPAQTEAWRARQKSRAWIMAAVLVALVVLIFLIAMRKMSGA